MIFNTKVKTIFLLLSLFLWLAAAPPHAQGQSGILSESDQKWLSEHKEELIFAPDPAYAPFEFFDSKSGSTKGLAHEYIKAIEKRIGVEFKTIKAPSFKDILSMAKEKKVAIVNAATQTPQRSEHLIFTDPILEIKNVILVRKNVTDDLTLDGLKGKKISVVSGYAVAEYLHKNYPSYSYDPVPADLNALLNTAYGISDAAIIDLATASYMIEKEGITNLRIAGDAGYPIKLAIGSRRDIPELNAILNKALKDIDETERKKIYRRWVHIDESNIFESRTFWAIVLSIVIFFTIIGSSILIWNRQLKKQVDIRTAALREARDRAEAACKAKSVFLANMSHELRTPMNAIIGFSSVLSYGRLTDEQKECVEMIKSSSVHLLELINDMLEFARLEAKKITLNIKPFDIRDLVKNSISLLNEQLKNKNIKLFYEIDSSIDYNLYGDPLRVKQILLNLLTNAIKFSPAGKIIIKAVEIEKNDKTALIALSIIDEGIGIPSDKIDEIFEMFHQLDNSSTRRHGGTGLGLSIIKGLAELMNAKIKVKSEVGKGSSFTVEIPFEIFSNQLKVASEKVFTQGVCKNDSSINIILAEDDEASCLLLNSLAKRFGWNIKIAGNGADAVEFYLAGGFDAILMDGQMPEMDGFDAAMKIRELEAGTGNRIPIIALTAYAMDGDKEKFIAAGMDDYITKPIDNIDAFYNTIMKYIAKK
jgi:signal transduction histidine kinase/CheY-like chemotaxis protein